MPEYTRELAYRFPLMMGPDVLAAQRKLVERGQTVLGSPDGLFGRRTERAVLRFQQTAGLTVTGVIDSTTWEAIFAPLPTPEAPSRIASVLPLLAQPHAFENSIVWKLTPNGVSVADRAPEVTSGAPSTVKRVWSEFGDDIRRWCMHFVVPAELIVATICTESGGIPAATRHEPGYVSDDRTPHRVSIGLMQTLISTARSSLNDPDMDGAWLLESGNSIKAGTAYIAQQWNVTRYDPPKVACAYNAGGIYHNSGANNRWKMRQYPIGTSHHADRYVMWFNDCFRFFAQEGLAPMPGFYAALNPPPA